MSADFTLNCAGQLVDLTTPKIMGILNITPDSFYDGGLYKTEKQLLLKVEKMIAEGATFIDIGACSSKPNATFVDETTEAARLLPVLDLFSKKFPDVFISVDTFRSGIAKEALQRGAVMINDIFGGVADPQIFDVVAQFQVPYIAMHIQGTPQNMQENPQYEDVVLEVYKDLSQKQYALQKKGVNDVVFDVGFGFGKTLAHNYQLLQNLDYFQHLKAPLLVGISRKSMLWKLLEKSPETALNGTTAAHTVALLKGANILRVHDVAPAIEAVKIVSALNL